MHKETNSDAAQHQTVGYALSVLLLNLWNQIFWDVKQGHPPFFSICFSSGANEGEQEEFSVRESAALTVITDIRLITDEILHWSAAFSISAALWSHIWQQIKDTVNSLLDAHQSDKLVDNWDDHRACWVMTWWGCTEVKEVKWCYIFILYRGQKIQILLLELLRRQWRLVRLISGLSSNQKPDSSNLLTQTWYMLIWFRVTSTSWSYYYPWCHPG